MPATTPTSVVQKALTVWHHNGPEDASPRPSPGPVDGLWGSRTASALDQYLRYMREQGRYASISASIEAEPRSSTVNLPTPVADDLFELERSYDALRQRLDRQGGGASSSPGEGGLPPVRPPSKAGMAWGLVAGLAVVGGLAYYFTRD